MDKVQAATKGLKMRRGSNATVAQTRWKVKTPDNNKSFMEDIETIEDTSQYDLINSNKRVTFEKISNVQFAVDAASGIPQNSAATRVTAVLLEYDRNQLGDQTISASSMSSSDSTNPTFDLVHIWKGEIG
jgi:hypothetical protein